MRASRHRRDKGWMMKDMNICDVGGDESPIVTIQLRDEDKRMHWIRPAVRCTKCNDFFELTSDGFKCPHCSGADPRDARIARLQAEVKAWRRGMDIYKNLKLDLFNQSGMRITLGESMSYAAVMPSRAAVDEYHDLESP